MKRRWPLALCLFCWFVILAVPAMRQMLWIQLSGGGIYHGWAYGPLEIDWQWPYQELREPADERAANDLRWQAAVADESDVKFGQSLDPLIQKHPRATWLIAKRLLKMMAKMRSDRVGGELSDINVQANRAAGIPSPERSNEKPNYTKQELEKALALARYGRSLEPDNGFWDWVQVVLLISDWRDEEPGLL
jgi:hypothetical protein